MTLQNLLAIKRLQAHAADGAAIRLLEAAQRNLADSAVTQVSADNRFVLDALRRQRNVSDYEGDPVSAATLASCIEEARKLLAHTQRWLQQHHPEWIGGQ